MCAISSTFSRLERLIEKDPRILSDNRNFNSLCRQLHVSPSSLNEYIEQELGYTGDELLEALRGASRRTS